MTTTIRRINGDERLIEQMRSGRCYPTGERLHTFVDVEIPLWGPRLETVVEARCTFCGMNPEQAYARRRGSGYSAEGGVVS